MFFCCTEESGCYFTHTFLALASTALQLLGPGGVNVLATKDIVLYGVISIMFRSDNDGFKQDSFFLRICMIDRHIND